MRLLLPLALLASLTGVCAAAAPAPAPDAQAAPIAGTLDRLYARLAKTRYSDEAAGIVAEIAHSRMKSGSDVADLLLARALQARAGEEWAVAIELLDAVVDLYPDWEQAWSQRATARLQSGDSAGAMGDLAQSLKRDPRDLGALNALGALLLDAGDAEAALKVYDRALELAPAYAPLKEARARARTKLWSLSP